MIPGLVHLPLSVDAALPRSTDARAWIVGFNLRHQEQTRPQPDLMVRNNPVPGPVVVAVRVTEAMDGRSLRAVGQLTDARFTGLNDLVDLRPVAARAGSTTSVAE